MHGFQTWEVLWAFLRTKEPWGITKSTQEYNQVCLPFREELLANPKLMSVFSFTLSMTGKINFQTGKAILLQVEFSRIPINFKQ